MSSKDIGPAVAVDPNLSLAAHEPRTRAWAFDAEFYSSIHPALVSDSDEIAANYIQEMLNTSLVARTVFFSFAMPSKRSGDSELGSHGTVFVTGVLNSQDILRLRTVRSIFPANIPVIWTPSSLQTGRGFSFTTCPKYLEYFNNCSKELEGSDSINPDALIRVDVRGDSDDVRPKKKGPKGPRKPMEPLDANLENSLAQRQGAKTLKPRSGRGVSCPSSGSRDENAAPPPTPPSAAPAAASGARGGASSAPVAEVAAPATPARPPLQAEPEVRPGPPTHVPSCAAPRRRASPPRISLPARLPASSCSCSLPRRPA